MNKINQLFENSKKALRASQNALAGHMWPTGLKPLAYMLH